MRSTAFLHHLLSITNRERPLTTLWQRMQKSAQSRAELEKLEVEFEQLVTNLRARSTPLRILVSTYNTPDGIGDAINMVGFYQILRRIFANCPQVEIKGVAYINTGRLPNFQRAISSEESDSPEIYYFDANSTQMKFDDTAFMQNGITIFSEPESENPFALYEVIERCTKSLKNFVKDCDLFLNIATPISIETHPFKLLKPTCCIHSILETGYSGNAELDHPEEVKLLRSFKEVHMGMSESEAGFKLDKKLQQFTQDKNQSSLMRELIQISRTPVGSSIFSSHLSSKENLASFKANHRLAIGYLQSEAATHLAAEVFMMTGDQSKDIILICNTHHIQRLLELNPRLNDTFSEIKLFRQNKKEIIHSNTIRKRCLTLIDFRGITNNMKHAFSAIADMTMGSGDNSRMDTLLCRMPFWQVLQWKIQDICALKTTVENDHPVLAAYLTLLLKASAWNYMLLKASMTEELIDFVNKNENQLVTEWECLRKKILIEHDIENYLEDVVLTFLNNVIDLQSDRELLSRHCRTIEIAHAKLGATPSESEFSRDFINSIDFQLKIQYLTIDNLVRRNAGENDLRGFFELFPYFDINSPYILLLGKPLLTTAVERRAHHSLRFLLKLSHANPNIKDAEANYMTPLHVAAKRGDVTSIEILLAHPCIDRDAVDDRQKRPFDYCALAKTRNLLGSGRTFYK